MIVQAVDHGKHVCAAASPDLRTTIFYCMGWEFLARSFVGLLIS